MKSIAKVLLVGAVAVMAFAASSAPSEAKKRAACTPMNTCSAHCKGSTCKVMSCGVDGKWHVSFAPVCTKPFCPSHC